MKTCVIFFLLSLAAYTLSAQDKFLKLRGGPKFDVALVSPEYSLWFTDELTAMTAWRAGGFVELGLGRRFALQAEGTHEQFIFKWGFDSFTIVEKVSYISIPVTVKFKLGRFGLYAGYQWSHLNFAERKMQQYGPDDPNGLDRIYEYSWHSANQMYVKKANSVLFGIEYTTRLGLGFNARYAKGLTDLTVPDIRNSIYVPSDEIYNTNISFGAYWSFGRKRS